MPMPEDECPYCQGRGGVYYAWKIEPEFCHKCAGTGIASGDRFQTVCGMVALAILAWLFVKVVWNLFN